MIEDSRMEIGRVVLATAGRDSGNIFVIVGQLDENHVLIANGTNRSIEKPKKKKLKHLKPLPNSLEGIREKILNGKKVFDAEIRKSLENLS